MSTDIGSVFGKLIVNSVFIDEYGRENCFCICECGETATFRSRDLNKKRKRSCGCMNKCTTYKHGMSSSPEYATWESMKRRCTSPNEPSYKNYGGRGITVCESWLNKDNGFVNFLSDMGERPKGKTLDRKDVNGNYCPENCRWATIEEQSLNKRSSRFLELNGVSKNLIDWCKEYGLNSGTLHCRLENGWSVSDAITLPVNYRRNNFTPKKCSEENCNNDITAKGLCKKHYANQRYKQNKNKLWITN